MILYHEASPDALDSILAYGLKRTSRGEMGKDEIIIKTNQLLDTYCPQTLQEAGVSRDNNTYAYLTTNDGMVDIFSGSRISEHEKIRTNHQVLLRIDVTATRCYVSDLDAYDNVKVALENDADASVAHSLARQYWEKIVRLDRYKQGQIGRPEVMITYDISSKSITVASSD